MNLNLNMANCIVVLIAFSAIECIASQPSYQVSVYVQLHPKESPVHFCNGVIIHSRFVMTTASCVHHKFSSSNNALAYIPSMISVITGTSQKLNEKIVGDVDEILVAENFNYITGANDLALLRLRDKLPLDTRTDINWIILAGSTVYESPCLSNFYTQSANGASIYIQSVQLPLLGSNSCRTASEHRIERKNDICSLYYPPTDFNCNAVETIQNYNEDRGTGLVCGNSLVGLLSTILPWQNGTDCIEKPTKAYYTAVVPHLVWIFNVISAEDIKMLNEGEYIESMPYAGVTNAVFELHVTASDSTPDYTTQTTTPDYTTKTTDVLAQHNAAELSAANLKLLSCILGIIYFVVHAVRSY